METENYLGYIIRKSSDPWMIKYNMPLEYFKVGGDGELYGAGSISEAKEEIDYRIDRAMDRLNRNQKVI